MPAGDESLAGSSAGVAATPRAGGNLATRVATAAVGIPLVILVAYIGGVPYRALIALVAVVGTAEGYRMLRVKGQQPAVVLGVGLSALLAIAPGFTQPSAWTRAIVLLGAAAIGVWFLLTSTTDTAFRDWAATVLLAIYVGGLLGSLVSLRLFHDGFRLVMLVLVLTWAYDTGAYLTGRQWGRHPFMSRISPSKTWEGVAGGLALSLVVSLAAARAVDLAVPVAAILGLAVAVAAQAGDLLESSLKRYAGVKDSGVLIPGHGGLLDRVDSLLLSSTVALYVLILAGHH
ncbi:MAG TPA: phosphatidate cytidylyltransferase [Chloroflexota bacterium]|nr:phosphatidate cytidylyltransferase [Chloroflexota bacterium]